ncbi:hypothetical protein PR002_g25394 [Phytophthora rubi]|uniref:Uncharacterized protein n=1 Tax=Phytophthora rubi TaxID=129364 RepID=A0A6A3I394_9STRA|nr:hypothetical protein PR002_g25394 [Phytophthora rubi]
MLRDWSSITSKSWADEDQRLRDVAMTPVDVKRGENIREMTADESQVLLAGASMPQRSPPVVLAEVPPSSVQGSPVPPPAVGPQTMDTDPTRYVTKLSGRAKKAARRGQAVGDTVDRDTTVQADQSEQTARRGKIGGVGRVQPGHPPQGTTRHRFQDFQRAEALGQYGALADEDSDEDEADFSGDNMSDIDSDGDFHSQTEQHPQPTPRADSTHTGQTAEISSSLPPHVAAVVARAPTTVGYPSGQEATEAPAFVQTTLTSFVTCAGEEETSSRAIPTQVEQTDEAEFVPATPDSQQDFTMGETHPCSTAEDRQDPIQVAQFLESFNGYEVAVEANGQCAMLAFYATISNHSTRTLKASATTIKQAGVVKRGVYALMMANLRRDAEVGIVDPVTVYHDLYPDHPIFDSKRQQRQRYMPTMNRNVPGLPMLQCHQVSGLAPMNSARWRNICENHSLC